MAMKAGVLLGATYLECHLILRDAEEAVINTVCKGRAKRSGCGTG